MVTRDRPTQSLIRATVAGPNLSTVPNPAPPPLVGVAAVGAEQVAQRQVQVQLGLGARPAVDGLDGLARTGFASRVVRSRAACRLAITPMALALRTSRVSVSPSAFNWAAWSQTRS